MQIPELMRKIGDQGSHFPILLDALDDTSDRHRGLSFHPSHPFMEIVSDHQPSLRVSQIHRGRDRHL
jgi:hypothetical protein